MGERSASRRYGRLDDTRLAALVREGDARAFEALYDRHQASLLAFCRHMLGSLHDGEDALQQTFLRAHKALSNGPAPDAMRPWLFAIARNRCRTLLAARRESAQVPEDFEPGFDGLAEDVGRRADLRELVHDLARLPDDQREALVLFELGGSSHKDIAQVLACPPAKVKALVFQARSSLIAERDARSTPCEAIREQLAVAHGGVLRRGPLRRHLRQCAPCDAYRLAVAGQRNGLALLLPVIPSAGLKAAVLAAAGLSGGGGTAAAAAGGGAASLLGGAAVGGGSAGTAGGLGVTALVAKVAVTVAVAGAGVSAAVAAAGSPDGVPPAPVRVSHPAQTRVAQPRRPATTAPAPARARPPARAATESPPVTTSPRVVVRTRAIRRHRARVAARRHRFRVLLRRQRIAALAPRRAIRIEARREARRATRGPRIARPRGFVPPRRRPALAGVRLLRPRRTRPAPVPQATATPIPTSTPTAALPPPATATPAPAQTP